MATADTTNQHSVNSIRTLLITNKSALHISSWARNWFSKTKASPPTSNHTTSWAQHTADEHRRLFLPTETLRLTCCRWTSALPGLLKQLHHQASKFKIYVFPTSVATITTKSKGAHCIGDRIWRRKSSMNYRVFLDFLLCNQHNQMSSRSSSRNRQADI